MADSTGKINRRPWFDSRHPISIDLACFQMKRNNSIEFFRTCQQCGERRPLEDYKLVGPRRARMHDCCDCDQQKPEQELTFQEALIKFNEENPWPFDIHEE